MGERQHRGHRLQRYLQQTAITGVITIDDLATSQTFNETIPSASFDSITFYNSNTDNGSTDNNLFFNNLSIVPEPSSFVFAAVRLAGMVAVRRCKR